MNQKNENKMNQLRQNRRSTSTIEQALLIFPEHCISLLSSLTFVAISLHSDAFKSFHIIFPYCQR